MSPDCGCLQHSVLVESVVITLTLVSALAITGETLLTYDLITVPEYAQTATNDSNTTAGYSGDVSNGELQENDYILDILHKVFHYTSLGIAALFVLEIFLKVSILNKKFVTKPWQILDAVIVLATLGVEIAFHFIEFEEKAIYCVKYIVVLRLWRMPMVCNIRARVLQKSVDQDLELYRHGRQKAEEKCNRLEETLSQQAETIRKLEGALQSLSGPKSNDMVDGNAHFSSNGQLPNNTTNQISQKPSSKMETSTPKLSSKKSPQRRSKQPIVPNEMETEFMDNIRAGDARSPTTEKAKHVGNVPKLGDKRDNDLKNNDSSKDTQGLKPSKNDTSLTDDTDATIKRNGLLPRSEASYNLHAVTTRPNNIIVRPRKRRSSTSEVIDYSNLNSPELDSAFVEEKSTSCPRLDGDEKALLGAVHEKSRDSDSDNVAGNNLSKKMSSVSDTASVSSQGASERRGRGRERKRGRRFTSCPEYVFTQRMSITNDESMLIEDGHTIDIPNMYDNLGFDYDEDIRLQVLAEFDGSKTYRNEDGIPMTSL